MDIINKLHSAFRDCLYFEFGEGYVKFYDQESKKYYKVTVEEETKEVNTGNVAAHISTQNSKVIKVTSKEKKRTWESILKEKNKK